MSDRKPCIRCGRGIDAWAKICPFCNWDQSNAVPAAEPVNEAAAFYVPPEDNRVRKKLLMMGGGVAMVIFAFLIGFAILVHKTSNAKEPEPTLDIHPEVAVQGRPKANVDLVPTNEAMPTNLEQPITSAPAVTASDGAPNNYQRTDATAVSSDEYAQLAARAKAEKKRMQALVDPRSLNGAAYAQGEPPPRRSPMPPPMTSASSERRISIRTRPVPEYQPLPNVHVSQNATARLQLLIGTDGRVKEVTVREAIPGETPRIIAAVQAWRFKPATENGVPVEAPFLVDISFHGNE